LIGPYFIEGNLTLAKYKDYVLWNQILLAIQAVTDENFNQIWFQQDVAAPHYGKEVRNYLNTLRHRILEEGALVEPDFIRNAVASFYYRITQYRECAFRTITMINEHSQNVFTMSIIFQVSKCPILI